jgi:hypothetical protein
MDELIEKYRKLNPFVQNAVGENIIWASTENDFCDVGSINEKAFKDLLSGIRSVNDDGKTRALFLVGPAGSGKSHLFARLRRRLPNGQFTFVCNPPTSTAHIKRFILRKVVEGMTRPVMGLDGPMPFSQLRRLVYFLLRKFLKPKGLAPERVHAFWKTVSPEKYPKLRVSFVQALANVPPLGIPPHVSRILFQVLDDEKCELAASWLSGNQNLSEADLQCLEIPNPLSDDEIPEIMKQLGHLSSGTGPIILILDQLDSLARPDQIREIESLMVDLNDGSQHWYVIVSLVHEKFDVWLSTLSVPFMQRFGEVNHGSVTLSTTELTSLSQRQRQQLIQARLSSPGLVFQRNIDGIDDRYFPVSNAAIQELVLSEITNPRMLIQSGMHAYLTAVIGSTEDRKIPLSDFIERGFADLRAGLQEENLAVDTAFLADRVEELFRLLWFVKSDTLLEGGYGPLHSDLPNFEGVDRIYNCGQTPVRVILYDVQQKNKFPTVLKRIVDCSPDTILIRDGRVRISGKATKEKLDQFQKDKKFIHLSLDSIKNLHALGSLLARMREGEFANEETEPIPTEEGIYECLAQTSDLAETDLAQAFLEMTGLEDRSGSKRGKPPPPGPDSVDPDDPIVVELTRIMEQERWMSFERLCARASSRENSVEPQRVYQCLKASPLCEMLLIYPRNANLLESVGIVIWNLEQ